jgi:hypothetical protein
MKGWLQKLRFETAIRLIMREIDLILLAQLNTPGLRKKWGIIIFSDKCPICKIGKDPKNRKCSMKCFLSTDFGCHKMYTMPKDKYARYDLIRRRAFWKSVLEFVTKADNSLFLIKNRPQLHTQLLKIDETFILWTSDEQ